MNNRKPKFIAIVGPTAVGKSQVALSLAKKIQGEIINADSVQVYRYMNIGTAKPSTQERASVSHHLLDIIDPKENFSVADYQKLAHKVINNVHQKGRLPIVVGGTGLYVKAITSGFVFLGGKPNNQLRKQINKIAEEKGNIYLYNKLKEIDCKAAAKIHPNDLRRITRALEFYYSTGQPISRQWELTRARKANKMNYIIFGLNMPREQLYERINQRVDKMIEAGFLEEVKELVNRGYNLQHKAMQALGYKHMLRYLSGDWTFAEAVETMKRDTRRYAKRQLTWFKKEKEIIWIYLNSNNIVEKALERICIVLEG